MKKEIRYEEKNRNEDCEKMEKRDMNIADKTNNK